MQVNVKKLKRWVYGAIVGYALVTAFFIIGFLLSWPTNFTDLWFWIGSIFCFMLVVAGATLIAYILRRLQFLEETEPQ